MGKDHRSPSTFLSGRCPSPVALTFPVAAEPAHRHVSRRKNLPFSSRCTHRIISAAAVSRRAPTRWWGRRLLFSRRGSTGNAILLLLLCGLLLVVLVVRHVVLIAAVRSVRVLPAVVLRVLCGRIIGAWTCGPGRAGRG